MGDLNYTPRTWVAGETVTAAYMNAEIKTPLTTIQSAMGSYGPVLTGVTLGNGTVVGKYNRVGKMLDFYATFTFGSTSAVTGVIGVPLPTGATFANWSCSATIFDTSAGAWYPALGVATTTAALQIRVWPAAAGGVLAATSSTSPMTWATGDVMAVFGRCEIP